MTLGSTTVPPLALVKQRLARISANDTPEMSLRAHEGKTSALDHPPTRPLKGRLLPLTVPRNWIKTGPAPENGN